MLWIDRNFDYGDNLARKYMKYNGEYYDVGTICKVKGHYGPVLVRFVGWQYHSDRGCFEAINDNDRRGLYDTYGFAGVMNYCLEIVAPVKPSLQQTETHIDKGGLPDREKPPSWDIEVAWIWYIVIMLVLVIFKDRWLGWIATSAIFFLWKNGILNGGKKK